EPRSFHSENVCLTGVRSDFSFFFFSSRRRHTRSKRDWSSDVCSSDLVYTLFREIQVQGKQRSLMGFVLLYTVQQVGVTGKVMRCSGVILQTMIRIRPLNYILN